MLQLIVMLVVVAVLARVWWVKVWAAGMNLAEIRAGQFMRALSKL